ncbi:CDP-alcohol phosphatidyltransferase family protein [Faecalimonas sp.]
MIGFYNYSVILTYIGLISSIIGMIFTINGHYKLAIFCLAFSGLCDMFDGKIARAMKNRTDDEKKFGIQIDSLCDVVCFGAFPVILCYCLGLKDIFGIMILAFYGTASVIRLGYFNVMEEKRQQETSEARKYYEGLPITTMAIILPIIYLLKPCMVEYFEPILHIVVLVVGFLLILRFQLKKPGNKVLAVIVVVVALAVLKVTHII